MADHKPINLEEVLRQLIHQDQETLRKTYEAYENSLKSLPLASLERVLASLLDPISFPNRTEFAQKLKQAYQRVSKNDTPLNNLRGVIGLVWFTLELLNISEKDIAEKQSQASSLALPNELLKDSAVREWLKKVYAPRSRNPVTTQASSTKKQEEDNLRLAKEYWKELNPDSLVLYQAGTTSFILRCRINTLTGEELVLKCLLFPYTQIPNIADATREYALQYAVGTIPETVRVHSSTDKWILMEFIWGPTLQELLVERRQSERTTPPLLRTDLLGLIGLPILKALGNLSSIGKQHENLTPSNIIVHKRLDESIAIIFIDLGRNYLYTSHLGLEASREALFVAPEVKNMEDSDRADLYSFGMILIELADPIGVQGHTVPDSLYKYAPDMARFIEDLIDKKPENRLLIFHPESGQNLYANLCSIFVDLLKALPPRRKVKLGKFFWI